jgi:ABC-type nitrate/sulfonate/bicarbonate transport system substrate-binding protein
MRWLAAPLATALAALALGACGDGGAEPGASEEATLVLDFQPNAVHTGIYRAVAQGYYSDRGVNLDVREPSASTDAPKLLASGRADFAILDIHDLGLAREQGVDVVGLSSIVGRPLAAVIARDRNAVPEPAALEGGEVGVTGLPSDDAVLDSVLAAGGADPGTVRRVTIGFDAVSTLAAGKLDAATAFWNAEGVALHDLGVPTREFRVDDYGAPRYPELILATSAEALRDDPELVDAVVAATEEGYRDVATDPEVGLVALLDSVPGLDQTDQSHQLTALEDADAFRLAGPLDRAALAAWARWDREHGILSASLDLDQAFPTLTGAS